MKRNTDSTHSVVNEETGYIKGKLVKGQKYAWDKMDFLGWSDGLDHSGEYFLDSYFTDEGVYLGPDDNGVEPLLS